jgi:hypothetical protein
MIPTRFDVEQLRVEMVEFAHRVTGARIPSEMAVAEG